jgi:hypothetical protein
MSAVTEYSFVKRARACEYCCVDCGGQAQQWSYKEPTGYSSNPDDYEPRC